MVAIHGMIFNGDSQGKINLMIAERIINPVKVELGLNLFKYNGEDIIKMIYFLTGNCHFKWTASQHWVCFIVMFKNIPVQHTFF